MWDSYVVLKDSRMFISSRTAMLSEDSFAVSSSRSAVLSCETERGKRHVYMEKIGPESRSFPLALMNASACMQMLRLKRKKRRLTGRDQ